MLIIDLEELKDVILNQVQQSVMAQHAGDTVLYNALIEDIRTVHPVIMQAIIKQFCLLRHDLWLKAREGQLTSADLEYLDDIFK